MATVDLEAQGTDNRLCKFCKQPLNSPYPSTLYHRECARTLEAHYAREVASIKKSLTQTFEVIDNVVL